MSEARSSKLTEPQIALILDFVVPYIRLLQADQADAFKCGGIIGRLCLPAGGDDPDIGICVQHGYLLILDFVVPYIGWSFENSDVFFMNEQKLVSEMVMAEGVPDPVRKVPFIELVLIDDAKVVICAGLVL